MNQTDVFREDEGDNWFRRNRSVLDEKRRDHVLEMVARANALSPLRSICELGCSNGWRLAAISEALPNVERLAGSDLSSEAIEDGCRRWPRLELTNGSLDEPNVQSSFDLVIVSFVFHWVARDRLDASISAVDGLVRNGGALIIADFLPDRPCARPYHHRSDVEILTYKQDYLQCFTGLGYTELSREIFSHGGTTGLIDEQDRAVCALLRKG